MAHYRSFLFPEAELQDSSILLDLRESYHLARVLRAKKDETIEVLDGKGTIYCGAIQSVSLKGVRVLINAVKTVEAAKPRILLLQSESKQKSMDLVLRMATEIGVSAIQPVFTEQGEHSRRNNEKRTLVMIEACKQCGLGYLPELHNPSKLQDWLLLNPPKGKILRLVASLEEKSQPLMSALKQTAGSLDEVVVAIGPAGDFSKSEYASLNQNGFQPVRLGANVLRVETAVAYTLSLVDQMVRMRKEQ